MRDTSRDDTTVRAPHARATLCGNQSFVQPNESVHVVHYRRPIIDNLTKRCRSNFELPITHLLNKQLLAMQCVYFTLCTNYIIVYKKMRYVRSTHCRSAISITITYTRNFSSCLLTTKTNMKTHYSNNDRKLTNCRD